MPDYRRYRVPGGHIFFTVNLSERHSNDLLVRHIDTLRTIVQETRKRWPILGGFARAYTLRMDAAGW
jgi:putative transposase